MKTRHVFDWGRTPQVVIERACVWCIGATGTLGDDVGVCQLDDGPIHLLRATCASWTRVGFDGEDAPPLSAHDKAALITRKLTTYRVYWLPPVKKNY